MIACPESSSTLERIYTLFRDCGATEAMPQLFSELGSLRARLPGESWRDFSQSTALRHPLRELVHQDPMTLRSFEKPRGYAGDAVLLDYIYRLTDASEASPLGRIVYDYAVGRPAARGVRLRRELIAKTIDRLAQDTEDFRVASIACGHLRELLLSEAMRSGKIARFVGLDADAESLEEMNASHPDVDARSLSLTTLLREPTGDLTGFDFVYSAGIYDYLQDRVAKRVSRTMFDRVRPGGRILFTNFLPTVADAGYMETYMGWNLILRDLASMNELTSEIPSERISEKRVYADPEHAIGYVEVVRR